LRFSVTSVILT